MRLITKKSKDLSRSGVVRRSNVKRGLVVESAEAVRFAHTAARLPSSGQRESKKAESRR